MGLAISYGHGDCAGAGTMKDPVAAVGISPRSTLLLMILSLPYQCVTSRYNTAARNSQTLKFAAHQAWQHWERTGKSLEDHRYVASTRRCYAMLAN